MNGGKPSSGTITIRDGQVTTDSIMTIDKYTVLYNPTIKKYEATKKYDDGEVVYFNVTTGEKCSSSDYTETQSNTEVKEECMKFYVFNDDGRNTVNLLLDHNTTATVAWNSSISNANGPSELLTQLKLDTSSWQGTETPANYTMDQTGQTSNANYTIDYSGYKARLITANEIATITGNASWDEKTATDTFYFDTNTTSASTICKNGNTGGCQYGWLYDRTNPGCKKYGCLNGADQQFNGYWTVSSRVNTVCNVWYVSYTAWLGEDNAAVDYGFGVRPVIEVLRLKLG